MRKVAALGLGLAALVMASCSGQVPGSARPSATGEAGTSAQTPGSSTALDVPKVTDPIDMSKYKKNPCAVLTESQLEQLSIPTEPETRLDGPAGPTCDWEATDETGISMSGGPVTAGAGSSLAASYERYRQGGFDNFKPVKFVGYPGYLRRKDGIDDQCTAAVAVRNDLLYSLTVIVGEETPYYGKPCVYIRKAAKLATMTMSGGS